MNKLIIGILLILAACLNSCSKGEDIPGTGFGRLYVNAVFSGDAPPLLVLVDNATRDTLKVDRPGISGDGVILSAGAHHLQLTNADTKKVLSDTTIMIAVTDTITLPTFFYTGTAALYDNLDITPEKDSMLVRFVTLDPTLPDVIDIEISLWDFGGTPIPVPAKRIAGVRKDRFSEFIQFPNPAVLLPPDTDPAFFYYIIEGFDPKDNNKKVLSIEDGSLSYIYNYENFSTYTPNAVISLGIGPQPVGDPTHVPVDIFKRIVP